MANSMRGTVIAQLANVAFKDITEQLGQLKSLGITTIQTSPMQQHCIHNSPWYRVYQPTGSTEPGNTLGTKEDIIGLITEAHSLGITVIADVVLHHTCACPICNKLSKLSSLAWFATSAVRWTKRRLGSHYPFERFNMLDWGPRVQHELDAALLYHCELITNLRGLGVDGFRFDAAKHIPASYFKKLLDRCGKKELWYCEILDGSVDVCREYINEVPGMKATDFPLTFRLLQAFGLHGDIRRAADKDFLSWEHSICIADCHDSILGDSYAFGVREDGILAAAFLLGRGYGIPLIWHEFLTDARIKAGLEFTHEVFGSDFALHEASSETLLVLTRGDKGLVVINKSTEWTSRDHFHCPYLAGGSWKELTHGFDVQMHNGSITEWGASSKHGGIRIGPREALFLIYSP